MVDLVGIEWESRTKTNNLRRSDGQDVFKVLKTINIFLILIKLKMGIQLSWLKKSSIEGVLVGFSMISLAALSVISVGMLLSLC